MTFAWVPDREVPDRVRLFNGPTFTGRVHDMPSWTTRQEVRTGRYAVSLACAVAIAVLMWAASLPFRSTHETPDISSSRQAQEVPGMVAP